MEDSYELYRVLLYTLIVIQVAPVESQDDVYLQIYPQVNVTDARTPLYFALMLSFGGDYTSIGALPGVQIALDYINNEPSILPNYTLHYTLTDSQCNRSVALESLFNQLTSDPVKLGWVGSGCSVATEPTAEITQFFNIPQVSCVSSSSELKKRQRFRYYFQLLAAESQIAQGFFKIITNFGWKRVRLVIQNENLFTVTMDVLKLKLLENGVEFTEKLFKTEDGIDGINDQIFDSDTRIYVVAMYSSHARNFLCWAFREGIVYPKYLLITYGWYDNEWWKAEATSSKYSCTAEQRASVLAYTLAPRVQESYTDTTARDASGISAEEYEKRYKEVVTKECNEEINLPSYIQDSSAPFYYAQHCHEATLAFAYALNKTIEELKDSNKTSDNASLTNSTIGTAFLIEDFQYNNSVVVMEMFKHLQQTSFKGLSGNPVIFDEDGIREVDVLVMYQYQYTSSSSNLILTTLGNILVKDNDLTIDYSSSFSADNPGMWPKGIPYDGIPIEKVVTVSTVLTVVYITLAIAGLVFACVCLVFTLVFRKKKLIRLSSPNLNYIIGLGAIILYLNVITFVIPTTSPDFVSVLCNLNPWLTSLGYSLCYGTILVKTVRIWIIFNKPRVPSVTQSLVIKDYVLALFVLCLVVIDILILGSYTAIEGSRDSLGVRLTSNKENIDDTIGSTYEIHSYHLYICEARGQVALFTILFGYKGLLQITALILAFSTRKVKVKGLDDSKYIAASIYVTSIVLAVTMVSTYTLMDYVNVYPAVVGMGFLLGTTMILGLVFVPRMVGLYRDPEGDSVKIMNISGSQEVSSRNQAYSLEVEVRKLRRRISELERSQQMARNSQMMGSVTSISNPDYMASSPGSYPQHKPEPYCNHQLHICTSSHDSTKDSPLDEGKRNVVRWSEDRSTNSPL